MFFYIINRYTAVYTMFIFYVTAVQTI